MKKIIFKHHKTTIVAVVGFCITATATPSTAQIMTYDDSTASTSLEDALSLELGYVSWGSLTTENWFNLTNTDNGVVYKDSTNNTVISGANLVVNYSDSATPIPKFIIGGYNNGNSDVDVTNNVITIQHGDINGRIYGGLSYLIIDSISINTPDDNASTGNTLLNQNLAVNNNKVLIKSTAGKINGDIYGGNVLFDSKSGSATVGSGTYPPSSTTSTKVQVSSAQLNSNSNTTSIESNANINGSIYGGNTLLNILTKFAYTRTYSFINYGADALAYVNANADAGLLYSNANSVLIDDNVNINDSVYGGNASINIQTENASAAIYVSSISGNKISATATNNIDATDVKIYSNSNSISINHNTNIQNSLYGGNASLNASTNGVTVSSEEVSTNAIGDNNINISQGQIHTEANTVSIDSYATILGSIYGGNAAVTALAGDISVTTNTDVDADIATISNININGFKTYSNANAVLIGSNTNVHGNVYGGNASLNIQTGSTTTTIANTTTNTINTDMGNTQSYANSNMVNFNGKLAGTNSAIYGGNIMFDVQIGDITIGTASPIKGTLTNTGSIAQAINNSVSIEQNATFNTTSSLYGGYLSHNTDSNLKPETYNVFSGNTLNYAASVPTTLSTVANFEHYNFTLTPEQKNTGTALITAQQIVLGTDESNTNDASVLGSQSNIAVVGIHSGNTLNTDDKFILMKSDNPFTGSGAIGQTNYGVAQQGISLLYDVRTDVDVANNQVTATILGSQTPTPTPARVNPQLKALSEGFLANHMLVNRGGDIIAYEAFNAINDQNHHNGWVPFIIASGQHNRYNSGSHIKSNDALITGGLSYQLDNITAAVIIEGGWGSYDSYNSFNHAENVHGDGHNNYYGVGLLGRYDFDNGLYTDASLRYGRSHIKFDTNDIRNIATDEKANYNIHTNYTSAHVGVGYLFPLDDHNELDISTKYLYTSTQGKHVTVAGDPIHFDRVNSNRVRFNAQFNHNYSTAVTFNAGAGYEYEFDGKAKATTYDAYHIDAPSVKGSTGIISLGANIKPVENSKLSFDSTVQGYVGKREGVSITLKANYAF